MKKYILLIVLAYISFKIEAQSKFQFSKSNINKEFVRFQVVNNLIVIPLEINGKSLSFILDSGVNKTILFNLSEQDTLDLQDVKRVTLQGLGSGEPVEALISKNNNFRIKSLVNKSEEIYIILNDEFDVSSKMGITIHGIIGNSLLKDVIADINYKNKKIKFYNPETYVYSKCRKCVVFPLQFYRNKPYINTKIQLDTIGNTKTTVKMLIDTGGSDALWLFEDTKEVIRTPKKYFNDIVGEGLSGTIYGNRSRIPEIILGRYKIKKPTVTFLDSVSTFNARKFKNRNGSIGSGILSRFRVWIDYPNKQISLKKNGSLNRSFYYNMSGLSVIYDGKELIKEEVEEKSLVYRENQSRKTSTTISFVTTYRYKFKSSYKVDRVVENSPAYIAGVLEGDIIKSINGKQSYDYNLEEIIHLFQTRPNQKIRLEIDRKGEKLKFAFRLKQRI